MQAPQQRGTWREAHGRRGDFVEVLLVIGSTFHDDLSGCLPEGSGRQNSARRSGGPKWRSAGECSTGVIDSVEEATGYLFPQALENMDVLEFARVRVNAFESGFSGSVLMWR